MNITSMACFKIAANKGIIKVKFIVCDEAVKDVEKDKVYTLTSGYKYAIGAKADDGSEIILDTYLTPLLFESPGKLISIYHPAKRPFNHTEKEKKRGYKVIEDNYVCDDETLVKKLCEYLSQNAKEGYGYLFEYRRKEGLVAEYNEIVNYSQKGELQYQMLQVN